MIVVDQPLLMREVQPVAPPGHHLPLYLNAEQVYRDEFLLALVTSTDAHQEIFFNPTKMFPGISGTGFKLDGLFRYCEHSTNPSIKLLYWLQVYDLILHLFAVAFDSISFQLGNVHGLASAKSEMEFSVF
jgi:hypothetical protein